jgi:hypothetical protein
MKNRIDIRCTNLNVFVNKRHAERGTLINEVGSKVKTQKLLKKAVYLP